MQHYRESVLFGGARPLEQTLMEGQQPAEDKTEGRLRATPAARNLARRQGVPLEDVPGGAKRVIRESDVRELARRRGKGQKDDAG